MKEKNEFWDIKNVRNYEELYNSGIKQNQSFTRTYALVKNLSYNSQYLEFLSKTLKKDLHASIYTELVKTFIITGMGIIESILYYSLKSKGLQKIETFKEEKKCSISDVNLIGKPIKIETIFYSKLDIPKEVEMNLDSMLKKTENKLLFGTDHSIYAELNKLRKLRNKIHLYLIEDKLDTDFNAFNSAEVILMKKALNKVLLSDIFKLPLNQKIELLDFLN